MAETDQYAPSLRDLEPPVFLVNEYATRARKFGWYVRNLQATHPYFTKATVVHTSADPQKTIDRLRYSTNDGLARLVIPVGGDTTFNQAAVAVEGTQNILCAAMAGNACNVPMNLQRRGGRVLLPHELLEWGSVQAINPIEMSVDDTRHLAVTIADIGMLSVGAQYLNGPLRQVPGYHNSIIRNLLHERMLLVGRTVLTPPIPITRLSNNTYSTQASTELALGMTVANARTIGHYACFPELSLTRPGAFTFTTPSHFDLPLHAVKIQTGDLEGTPLKPADIRVYRLGRSTVGSVDGQDFAIEKGQTVTFAIAQNPLWVLGLPEHATAQTAA